MGAGDPEQELEGWKALGKEEATREVKSEGEGGSKCVRLERKKRRLSEKRQAGLPGVWAETAGRRWRPELGATLWEA